MFQDFIKLEVSTSTMPTNVKGGRGKAAKATKPKAILPFVSFDDDHDEDDEHEDATPVYHFYTCYTT